jgi:hypothetical protein
MIKPLGELDLLSPQTSLGECQGDFGAKLGGLHARGAHDHAGKPRRERQTPEALAGVGDTPALIEGVEFDK